MVNRLVFVDAPQKMQKALKDIASSSVLGIDTEYDSMRYFREKLCLVQIATETKVYIFDPLGTIPLVSLGEMFASDWQTKIFHAAENDIRLLKRDYGFTFNSIFDTQRGATLLGYSDLSLARVIEEVLGIKFVKNKSLQRSRWDKRPLSAEQIEYAGHDVFHLFAIHREFTRKMEEAGVTDAARKSFNSVAQIKWSPRIFDKDGYTRLAGFADLTPRQQSRLRGLYQWRFYRAKMLDIAVYRVMSDSELVNLANGDSADER
ncbi:MAG: ribonuclease D [Deltaproteobacteria bacterium]|nr:ribonuclease D [Deltaproteobacteria bacterium]